MAAKLSPAQLRVVNRMREGWELGRLHESIWLQKGGCGYGGPSERVNRNTFDALYNAGVIVAVPNQSPFHYPRIYILTEKGVGDA